MTDSSKARYRIENDIKQHQNKITDSYIKIKQLEQKTDGFYDDMAKYNRIKEDHERFIHDYQTKTNAFIEVASSYNFIKQYESRRDELLYGPNRRKAEEELCAMESTIRKSIADTEDEIDSEKRKTHFLKDQLDSLEHDLSKFTQK